MCNAEYTVPVNEATIPRCGAWRAHGTNEGGAVAVSPGHGVAVLADAEPSSDNEAGSTTPSPLRICIAVGAGGQHEMERSMRHPEMQTTLLLFDDVHHAFQAATVVRLLRERRLLQIGGAALLHRDPNGRLHIDEFDDMTAVQGIAGGLLLGLVVGTFLSPTVVSAAISAAIVGGLIGRFVDRGINDNDLQHIGHQVPPRHSALLVVALPADLDVLLNHVSGQIDQLSPPLGAGLSIPIPLPRTTSTQPPSSSSSTPTPQD